ncbi:MAG TPA: polysaccharide biosynthesis tyrosine autokinase [Hyphomicrobium sp.]|nr:polysaccharide biosynthesis tyrosine autokinase [Hyphomicrobium sp.]
MQERFVPNNLNVHSATQQSGFVSYSDIFRLVSHYAGTIILSVGVTLFAVIAYLVVTEPVFKARTEIIIDPKMPQMLREQTGEISFSMDTAQVESQMAVLRSEKIAATVVDRLNLMNDPEFGPRKRSLFGLIEDRLRPHKPVDTAETQLERRRAAIRAFEDGLDVGRVGMSYVIEIYFSSNDPVKAAKIANAVTAAYVDDQLESKAQTSRQGSEWLEERIDQLRGQMNEAAEKVQLFKATHDYRIARKPAAGDLDSLLGSIDKKNGAAVQADGQDAARGPKNSLEELESTAATYKRIYESYLQAFTESVQRQSFPVADARVITPATQPLTKSSPKTIMLLAFGTMLGGLAGIGISFARHIFDSTIRVSRHITEAANVDCLGDVPSYSAQSSFGVPGLTIRRKPTCHFGEVLRSPDSAFTKGLVSAQTAISLATWRTPVRSIGFTSASECEGKTTLAANFAALQAKSGLRVLLIDCDSRAPTLSNKFAPGVESGLWEALSGDASLESAMVRIDSLGIDLLPISSEVPLHRGAFPADGMRALLKKAATTHDMVIVDMPEIKNDLHALSVSALLDGVILAVSCGRTSAESLAEAADMLRKCQSTILGAIINRSEKPAAGFAIRQFKTLS